YNAVTSRSPCRVVNENPRARKVSEEGRRSRIFDDNTVMWPAWCVAGRPGGSRAREVGERGQRPDPTRARASPPAPTRPHSWAATPPPPAGPAVVLFAPGAGGARPRFNG